jgi:L-arabinonolactonase
VSKCDRHGRFFAGGMDDKEELKICGLWRLDPDLTIARVDSGIICSNGPCWSPDDKTFYFADTFQEEIWAYDYDIISGTPSRRRLFASTASDPGVADGSTVDAEGFLWNAQLISGDLVRYAPDGSVERRIGMPVRNITSIMFGGPNLETAIRGGSSVSDSRSRHKRGSGTVARGGPCGNFSAPRKTAFTIELQ